jgi:thymidylate synthase (FAD)
MQFVEPKVHMVASTQTHAVEGIGPMLRNLGVPDWTSDAAAGAEELIEVSGRMCYKSFGTELNANITKTREGNASYIGNILKSGHGSVLEHASVTFALLGVSRIFTHELVRHRAGTAFSQESGRYVRIDEVRMASSNILTEEFFRQYINDIDPAAALEDAMTAINDTMDQVQDLIAGLNQRMIRDDMPFDVKKKITSFIRRFSPNGQVNDIIVTANHRAWRHIIAMRTSPGAEEEIRKVFHQIAVNLACMFPNIYQDMRLRKYENESDPQSEYIDTTPTWNPAPLEVGHWVFENEKV